MKNIYFILFFIGAFGAGLAVSFLIANFSGEQEQELVHLNLNDLKFQDVGLGGPSPEIPKNLEVNLIPGSEQDESEDGLPKYVVKRGGEFPYVESKAFIIADIDTGDIIASRKLHQVYPIASITKLMTAVIVGDVYDKGDEVKISRGAVNTYGKQGRLSFGEVYTIEEMLYPLLLESSNDAAEALAESGGRSSFMSDMNSKADSLGLNHTRFLDPSGLSSGNTSTVSDLFALMQYINEFREDLFDITQLKKYRSEFYNKTWYSNSRFKNDTAYIGGKNGYTDEARKTQAAIFQLPLEGNDGFRNIAIILLNGKDTTSDIRGIISFLNEFVYYE